MYNAPNAEGTHIYIGVVKYKDYFFFSRNSSSRI